MLRVFLTVSCLMAAPVLATRAASRPPKFPSDKTDSRLRKGKWDSTSASRIGGVYSSRVVQIDKAEGDWTISFTSIHRSIRQARGNLGPTIKRSSSYPFSQKSGVLTIKRPEGTLNFTGRFNRGRSQFPAVVRNDARTFRYQFSKLAQDPESKKKVIRSWSQTWVCDADPSKERKGTATIIVSSPSGNKTLRVTYRVKKALDGPAILFEGKDGKKELLVWGEVFGLQVYKGAFFGTDIFGTQGTYSPISKSIKAVLERNAAQHERE